MTKPKTSIEKLETRNEKVKDLKSARNASRWKWEKIREQANDLWNLMDHTCGFCILAMQKRTMDHKGKCVNCPTEIKEECDRILSKSSELSEGMDELINKTREFLEALKY